MNGLELYKKTRSCRRSRRKKKKKKKLYNEQIVAEISLNYSEMRYVLCCVLMDY